MTELVDPTNSPGVTQTVPPSQENLFDRLNRTCGTQGAINNEVDCDAALGIGTREFVKAMCTSVLGSAAMAIQ